MTTRRGPACIFVLLSAVGLLLLAPDARSQGYPPAFTREGARQVFDNMWITAWETTRAIPDKPTPMHRHPYDYFGLELTDSKTDTVSPEGDKGATVTFSGDSSGEHFTVHVDSTGSLKADGTMAGTLKALFVDLNEAHEVVRKHDREIPWRAERGEHGIVHFGR